MMSQGRDMSARITVFMVNNEPIGTCPAGQEQDWLSSMDRMGNRPSGISQLSSTEGKWHAYAVAQGRGASKAEAVRELY